LDFIHSRDLAIKLKHTDIVVMTAAHRHDLHESSCIKKEIQIFNRKLWKVMKTMDHAVTVEATSTRNNTTKHGLHLSMTGKERMANLIGKKIKTLLAKQRKLAVIIKWKENHKDITQEEDKINVKNDSPPNQNENESRTSRRQKRAPVTRIEDCLWWVV
jgi:hypothetical protein